MPDGTPILNWDHFYEGMKAESFVTPKREPKDEITRAYVADVGMFLGLLPQARPTNNEKIIRCLSDFLVSVKQSRKTGLIAWPMNANNYARAGYSHLIAKRVKKKLESHGLIKIIQRPRQGLSTIYKVNNCIAPSCLKFKERRKSTLIEIRAASPGFDKNGDKRKGRTLNEKHFQGPELDAKKADMKRIVKAMSEQPLQGPEGIEWCSCKRIFNNASLRSWGRVYGDWQNVSAEKRLHFTIENEPVCQIDIKASFLFLASCRVGVPLPNMEDPYKALMFVGTHPEYRDLAKILVSTILSSKVPKAFSSKKHDFDGEEKTLKERFNIGNNITIKPFIDDIMSSYPYLRRLEGQGGSLAHQEAELIITTMLRLLDHPNKIVCFPVHDCLIAKQKHKEEVTDTLTEVMLENLGAAPALKVEYPNKSDEVIIPECKTHFLDWHTEDDIILIEDD